MKKTLLGTSALVTASLLAGPAFASDPLTVTVSGGIVTGFYFVDSDDLGSTDDTKVAISARSLEVNGEGTLDNGLVAGASLIIELGDDEGASTSQGDEATFQEAFAYLEGGFGRVEIGGTDGAAFKMHYTSPWFVPGNGVDSPNIFNSNGVNTAGALTTPTFGSSPSTYALATEDAPKISYFTPRLSGFQLGVSYTPDAGVHDPYANGWGVSPTNSSLEEVFEVAANYAGEIGSVELGVDVFYVTGEAGTADPEEIGAGASLGFAGFTLGGAYKESQDLSGGYLISAIPIVGGADVEETVWTVGLAYGTGPWTVGVAYIESEIESGTVSGNSLTTDFLQVGGGYSLGAGVDLGLDIQFINNEIATAGGSLEVEDTSAGVVLAISF